MTFAEIQSEFYSRGFDYLNQDTAGQTRAKRWINQSYLDLCERYHWPFLYADTSGTAPLTITDLRAVLEVTDRTTDRKLDSIDRRDLTDMFPDLPDSGSPSWYYLDSSTSLAVYPASTTDTIQVRYLKVPAELSVAADEPVVPARFQDLIVDGAVIRGYKDSDNFESAALLTGLYELALEAMVLSLLVRTLDRPDAIVAVRDSV